MWQIIIKKPHLRKVLNGGSLPLIMLWSLAQVIGKQLISLGMFGVLSVLLEPADFGLVAMAMIWITFLDAFSETGFSSALIQRQNVNATHFSSIFALNVSVGALLSVLGMLLAWPASIVFNNPMVAPLMATLSLGFLVNSLSLTQVALAQKQLHFKNLAIRDTVASLVGGAIGIFAALQGAGAWSLVIQTLVTYTVGTVTLWGVSKWRPKQSEMQWSAVKELWSYSSTLFKFNFFKFFAQNTDKFFISSLLGEIAMGLYSFAFRFTSLPVTTFVGAVGIYLFPKFSAMQDQRADIRQSYLVTTKATQAMVVPLLVMVASIAPAGVAYIWHDKWLAAIPVIQVMCVLAFAQSLISPIGQLQKALDKPRWLLWWSIGATVAIALALPLAALQYGIVGGAWAITAVYLIGVPVNYATVAKLIELKLSTVLRALLPSLLAGAAMALTVWVFTHSSLGDGWAALGALVGGSVAYGVVELALDWKFIRSVWFDYLSRLLPKKSSL